MWPCINLHQFTRSARAAQDVGCNYKGADGTKKELQSQVRCHDGPAAVAVLTAVPLDAAEAAAAALLEHVGVSGRNLRMSPHAVVT